MTLELEVHCEGAQVGAQTETELKEKMLRVEDALNATKDVVEEGIVVGGRCALLRLASKVDAIKDSIDGDEQKVGADIVKRALSYPLKLIAKNTGVNGTVVTEKVLANDNLNFGYNAATANYEDLMAAGIIDPTKLWFFKDSSWNILGTGHQMGEEEEGQVENTWKTRNAIRIRIFACRRIHEGNMSNGVLKCFTNCYRIASFDKFLGPYYMLLITQRRKIGIICGHTAYDVSKSKMIALQNSTMWPNMAHSKDENRSFVHSTQGKCDRSVHVFFTSDK